MGIDVGFDLYPPLKSDAELAIWSKFLRAVVEKYRNYSELVEDDFKVEFAVGEHPVLLKDGRFFRRFSSKISGSCGAAQSWIEDIYHMAKTFFPRRVHFWSEYGYEDERDPAYSWPEVLDSEKLAAEAHKRAMNLRRRKPFIMVLAGYGYLSTLSRAMATASLLPAPPSTAPSSTAPSSTALSTALPPDPDPLQMISTDAQRTAYLLDRVLVNERIIKAVLSYI